MPTGSMINRALRYYFRLTFAHGDVAESLRSKSLVSSIILRATSAAPTMTMAISASKRRYRDADEDREKATS